MSRSIRKTDLRSSPAKELSDAFRRQTNFIPGLIRRLRQDAFITQVKFIFEKDALLFTGIQELELIDGKHLARSFLRAGIRSITLKEMPSNDEIADLESVLRKAQNQEILDILPHKLMRLGIIENIEEVQQDQADNIPGTFKHYTSYQNYLRIIQERKIETLLHRKNGEILTGIYLTRLSLPPEEAHDLLFIGSPEYAGKVTHVIAFEVKDPGLLERIEEKGVESFLDEAIIFDDPRIQLTYHGPNYIRAAT